MSSTPDVTVTAPAGGGAARHRAPGTEDALPLPTGAGSVAEWTQRYTHAVMDTFGAPQRVLVRGEGPYVWDADGKRYLEIGRASCRERV